MPEAGYVKRKAVWTEEEIKQAIKDWVARYGEVPASTDWHPGDCLRSARISAARSQAWLERAARFKEGEYPWPATVRRVYGRWSSAIRAAGFEPRRESMPLLKNVTTVDNALVQISECLRQAGLADDPKERRLWLSQIVENALAALESDADES